MLLFKAGHVYRLLRHAKKLHYIFDLGALLHQSDGGGESGAKAFTREHSS